MLILLATGSVAGGRWEWRLRGARGRARLDLDRGQLRGTRRWGKLGHKGGRWIEDLTVRDGGGCRIGCMVGARWRREDPKMDLV